MTNVTTFDRVALASVIATANRLAKNGVSEMTEKLSTYDPATALVDDEEIAFFMADAVETDDSAYIARARDAVARVMQVVKISAKKGPLSESE